MQGSIAVAGGHATVGSRKRVYSPAVARCGAWMALIFGTSCYHITLRALLHAVEHTSNPAFNQAFRRFWLADCLYFIKGWHFLEYATLLCLGVGALRALRSWDVARSVRVALPLTILYAASDEWHQTFVPGRGGRVTDVLIDSAGGCMAAFILVKVAPRFRAYRTRSG